MLARPHPRDDVLVGQYAAVAARRSIPLLESHEGIRLQLGRGVTFFVSLALIGEGPLEGALSREGG